MIKKYHVSKNLLNLYGNQYFNYDSSVIGVDGEKLICDYIASGASSRIIYSKYYPAGTYTISCKLNNLSKLRIVSPENFGGTWNSFYNGYYIDADSSNTITITSNVDFRLGLVFLGTASQAGYFYDIMFNSGSLALPYEPYGNTWNLIPYRQYHLNSTSLTSDEITTDGSNMTAIIEGNMVQNGTPTPSIPIQPQKCGDRTENLINPDFVFGSSCGADSEQSVEIYFPYSIGENRKTAFVYVEPLTTYTFSSSNNDRLYIGGFSYRKTKEQLMAYTPNNLITSETVYVIRSANVPTTFTFTTDAITKMICIYYSLNAVVTDAMLNTGSPALPYIPYGYKIPIISGGMTTNVYLGEVQSIRQIKKMVMTGEEDWNLYEGSVSRIGCMLRISNMKSTTSTGRCTHFSRQYSPSSSQIDGITFGAGNNYLYITFSSETVQELQLSNITSIKQWFAEQYSNGTPVTVWYILAEPTATTLNEPIRKIGDYTDSISVANIPTTLGTQTFTVNTTLQPSDIKLSNWWETIGYGKYYSENRWIDSIYNKYTIGYWENFTISEMETKTINQLQGGN